MQLRKPESSSRVWRFQPLQKGQLTSLGRLQLFEFLRQHPGLVDDRRCTDTLVPGLWLKRLFCKAKAQDQLLHRCVPFHAHFIEQW